MTEFSPDQDQLSQPAALNVATSSDPEAASQVDIFGPTVAPQETTEPESDAEEHVGETTAQESAEADPSEAPAEVPNPLAEAFLKLREGRGRETADLYHDIVKPAETPLAAQMDRGRRHGESGRHELAIEEFLAAVESDPQNAEALAHLATSYGALGRFGEADDAIARARHFGPEDIQVQAGEAILAFRRGLYSEAEVRLERVCAADPSHGPAHFYRGEALNRLGHVAEAVETMERALELQPLNWRACHTLGMLFDRLEDRERASEMYRQARELNRL